MDEIEIAKFEHEKGTIRVCEYTELKVNKRYTVQYKAPTSEGYSHIMELKDKYMNRTAIVGALSIPKAYVLKSAMVQAKKMYKVLTKSKMKICQI